MQHIQPENTLAEGANYFDNPEYPLTVRRIRGGRDATITHEHDLTGIRHSHDFCELALITNGRALHWLEGDEFAVTAGDVFVLQGQQSHFYRDLEDLEMINVMFDPAQLELPENRLQKIPGYRALFLLEPLFRKQHRFTSHLRLNRTQLARADHIATVIEKEVTDMKTGYEVAMYSRFIELVVFLSRLYNQSESANANSEAILRVAKVIGGIEEDFSKQWKVDDFAAMAHMSRSHFIRIFRTATGLTPINYLLQLRLQKSTQLLTQTSLNVSQIAFEVGFNDSNYFTRQFKRAYQVSPKRYRQTRTDLKSSAPLS